jgi:hypothetical protein
VRRGDDEGVRHRRRTRERRLPSLTRRRALNLQLPTLEQRVRIVECQRVTVDVLRIVPGLQLERRLRDVDDWLSVGSFPDQLLQLPEFARADQMTAWLPALRPRRAPLEVGDFGARVFGFEPSTAHLRRYCANRRRNPIGRDDSAAVVHADLCDQQPEEFLRLFGALRGEDLVELVGEAGEGGGVRRRVRLCGQRSGEVGFLELSLDASDLRARRRELLLDARSFLSGERCRLGERALDQLAVAVEPGELCEDG